ncbi:hypothetical protein DVH05_009432 [Phytophthora capsici]|nr:hypothetical protein DVH05_009432 [Phytophthora capsici]
MDGEPTHESGWEERHDEASGQVYYWNAITGETSWEPPEHLATTPEAAGDLVPPWTQAYTEDGRAYYLNTETMETQWTPPSAIEHGNEALTVPESSVFAVTGGRGRRPSTAEQIDELNRLLSGEDDGEGAATDGSVEGKTPEICPWMMFVNEADGVPYYYNQVTGECLWDPPEEFLRFHHESQAETTHEATTVETKSPAEHLSIADKDPPSEPVVITAEFEEKVRQAIASVSSTPVGSSRLVLVHTPTHHQLSQVTASSARSRPSSARPTGSGRPTTGSSRPSSGAVRTPATSSRLEPVIPSVSLEESSHALQEEIVANEPQREVTEISAEELGLVQQRDVNTTAQADAVDRDIDALASVEVDKDLERTNDTRETLEEAKEEVETATEADKDLMGTNDTREMLDEIEAAKTVAVAALQQRADGAALTIQCMIRCFLARRRVKHRRKKLLKTSPPVVSVEDDDPPAPSVTLAEASDFVLSPPREAQGEETSLHNTVASPQLEDLHYNDGLTATFQQLSTPSVEAPLSVPVPLPTAHVPIEKQRDRTFSTRLPSVLNVSTYFSQRRSSPDRSLKTESTAISEQAAITRKKVELGSPVRAHRTSQLEPSEHGQLLETRKKQDEVAQRAQLAEYQRIYAESRAKFKEEQQRLEADKQICGNQLLHDIEVEKRTRTQQREAERSNIQTIEADELVWKHLKTQGRPTDQSVRQFREALAQAVDPVQFPSKMSKERARELHQRIQRLRHASWAVDSQLESVELALLSELHPLTDRQRPLQAKYAATLRCRYEEMLSTVQGWQRVLDDYESGKESTYWRSIETLYSAISSEESRRQYVLNEWRGAAGGDSLLHVAAWNGWQEHVEILIKEGADVNLIDSSASRRTPLHEACEAGHVSVVELLLRAGARWDAMDVGGDSPLHVACRGGWTRVVRVLLMAANDFEDVKVEGKPMPLEDFFNLRNGKGRRAIEVAKLPSLVEELQNYDYQLNNSILPNQRYAG